MSKVTQYAMMVSITVGIGIWFAVADRYFPRQPGAGFDMTRVLAAAMVGAVAGAIGGGVGKLIEYLRK